MIKHLAEAPPEQEYFSLESVAKEWGRDVQYVFEQFWERRLIPSIRLPQLSGTWWHCRTNPMWLGEEMGWDWDGISDEDVEDVSNGVWYLPAFIFGRFHQDEHGNLTLSPGDCFLSKDRNGASGWFLPLSNPEIPSPRISVLSLLVSKKEKDRFCHKYRVLRNVDASREDHTVRRRHERHPSENTPQLTRKLLSEAEAAKYIGMSPSFLKQGRQSGPVEGRTPPATVCPDAWSRNPLPR